MATRPLEPDSEWKTPQGTAILLCAIHEIEPSYKVSRQAVTIIYGNAVCREHLEEFLREGRGNGRQL